ncbi:MAG: carbohydrate ABC transporter permease [Lachnospiraceae bacterium]|nr:carbohydrate ABC transporter permease [Lachnospiraceae bacterium]
MDNSSEKSYSSIKRRETIANVVIYVILIFVAVTMLVPFIWMILTAFKSVAESTQVDPFIIFPSVWRMDNFQTVVENMGFVRLYWNTLLMIALRVLCAVLTATFAGYAFARLEFPGKTLMFSIVLLQMMVPVQLFIIPQYVMVSKLGWINTIWGLLFPGLVSAFGTFLLRQAYMSLPKELEEAARLDGCNIGQTFVLVMAPLARSSMVALGIFTAVFAYKDLMWPMIVCPDTKYTTLSSALAKMQGQFVSNYPQLMAGAFIACLPMIVLYVIFQRQFIEGIATSGGKL